MSEGKTMDGVNGGNKSVDRVVPYAVLAELSHRCPLQCPYCSNPLALE